MSNDKLEQIAYRYRMVKDSPFELVKIQNDEPYDCMPYYDHFIYRHGKEIAKFGTWALGTEKDFLVNALGDIEHLLMEVRLLQSKVRELESKQL